MKRAIRWLGRILLRSACELTFFAALANWQLLTKKPLDIRTAVTLAVLFGLLRLMWRLGEASPVKAAANVSERNFVDSSEAVLALSNLSGFDYIKASTPYPGKWMTISGRYEGMAESLRKDSIHVSLLLRDSQRINLRFGLDAANQLRGLQMGRRITVNCQIPRWGNALKPENCELMRIESSPGVERGVLARVS
jgi:hypothetical protein